MTRSAHNLRSRAPAASASASAATVVRDEGLRRYMLAIYGKLTLGLGLAALAAAATAYVPAVRGLLLHAAPPGAPAGVQLSATGMLLVLSPVALLLVAGRTLRAPTPRNTAAIYWSMAALLGAVMGVLMLSYPWLSLAGALALAAFAFGGLSLAGYLAPRSLAPFGAFLWTGLAGFLGALALSLALRSPAVTFATHIIGVIVFAGLIAYDTQRLKAAYDDFEHDARARAIASNCGALSLLLSFLNLFQILLLMGSGEQR